VRGVLDAMSDLGRASQMPGINPEPFVEAAGAKGEAVGKGLMNIGDVMGALAIKGLEAADDKAKHEAYAATQASQSRLRTLYATERDSRRFVPETRKELNALNKTYGQVNGVSPAAQHELAHLLDRNAGESMIEAGKQVNLRKFDDANGAISSNIELAIQRRNYGQARDFARERELKLYADRTQTEVTVNRINILEREDISTVNPKAALAELSKPAAERIESMRAMTPADDERYRRGTMDEWQKGKAAVMDVIHQKMAGKEIVSAPDFFRLYHGKLIDPNRYLSDEELIAVEKMITYPVNDDAAFEGAHRMIETYDAIRDESGVARATISTEIDKQFIGGQRNELQSQLAKQTQRTQARGKSAMDAEMTEALDEVNNALEAGDFGVWKIRYQVQPAGPFSIRNVDWDDKSKSWVRDRFSWETGPERVPIKISQEQAQQLTKSGLKEGEFVVDLDARREASARAGQIRRVLQDRREAGEFKIPEDLRKARRALMDGPAKMRATRELQKGSGVSLPSGPRPPAMHKNPSDRLNSILGSGQSS
jgi:hypothetical protein